MSQLQLHKAQISILTTLRHNETARYSSLMHRVNMESDVFKFHVRKLVHQDYVEKLSQGGYRLTARGKEFANNLDAHKRAIQKQPKLSLILVVSRNIEGKTEYLYQKRSRQPYWGYWGFLSGPIKWGASAAATAAAECVKQTGLHAQFKTAGFLRQLDYDNTGVLLEDKLFQIFQANIKENSNVSNEWRGGDLLWATPNQYTHFDPKFPSTEVVFKMLNSRLYYLENRSHFDADRY